MTFVVQYTSRSIMLTGSYLYVQCATVISAHVTCNLLYHFIQVFLTNCWFRFKHVFNNSWSTHASTINSQFKVKGKLACAQSKICTWLHLSQLLQYIRLIWLQLPLSLMQMDIKKKSMSPKHCSLFAPIWQTSHRNINYFKILFAHEYILTALRKSQCGVVFLIPKDLEPLLSAENKLWGDWDKRKNPSVAKN